MVISVEEGGEGGGGLGAVTHLAEAGEVGAATSDDGFAEGHSHLHGVPRHGYGGVHKAAIGPELHGLGGVAGGSYARVNHHGDCCLLDDDAEEVPCEQPLIRPDGRAKRHDGCRSRLFEPLAEGWIGLTIGENDEAQAGEALGGTQCLGGIRQEVAGVGVDLELEPVGPEGITSHLCGEDCLVCVAHPRRVRQQLQPAPAGDVGEEIVALIGEFDAFHCHGDHLRAACRDGGSHEIVVAELACAEEQAGAELFAGYKKFIHKRLVWLVSVASPPSGRRL